jgi:hypothetical protein
MKKRVGFFLIGMSIFLISLPLSTQMTMELFHNQKMNKQFKITTVSEGEPPTDSSFVFEDHVIEIKESLKDEVSYIDPWKNMIMTADLSLIIDDKEIDSLNNHPVRVGQEGLNRYYGEIAYLILEDKKKDEKQFILLLKKTREMQKEMPNGDIVGGVPTEKLKYTLHSLDEKGKLTNETFSFNNRDALQTKLLNAGAVVPYTIGYYTDAWEGYPTIFSPYIFPFFTLLVGVIMMLTFSPLRKVR